MLRIAGSVRLASRMPSAVQTQLLDLPEGALSPVARCKRILLALLAVLVLSSEFSGTALLVWVRRHWNSSRRGSTRKRRLAR